MKHKRMYEYLDEQNPRVVVGTQLTIWVNGIMTEHKK